MDRLAATMSLNEEDVSSRRRRRAETMEAMRFAWARKPKRKWKRYRENYEDESQRGDFNDVGDKDKDLGECDLILRRGKSAENCFARRRRLRRERVYLLNDECNCTVVVQSEAKVPFLPMSTTMSNVTSTTASNENSFNRNFSTKWPSTTTTSSSGSLLLMLVALICYVVAYVPIELASGLLLLRSSCLTNVPNCACLWKNGKFVAECNGSKLRQVPNVSVEISF